ncbi:hypothetical protein Cni_G19551 [Canna indica]|uniref:Uncharacterized protein n=1 Tax=Canna indica TaxID=4628 RepID=A0AAQ3KND3_9LILI|nr:hypothetical protein Cni_G19551 [Canna indica]
MSPLSTNPLLPPRPPPPSPSLPSDLISRLPCKPFRPHFPGGRGGRRCIFSRIARLPWRRRRSPLYLLPDCPTSLAADEVAAALRSTVLLPIARLLFFFCCSSLHKGKLFLASAILLPLFFAALRSTVLPPIARLLFFSAVRLR